MNIEQLLRECDDLAARYYRLDSGSRERAARDWRLKCDEAAKMIKNRSKKPKMNVQNGFFNSTLC
jgi:hypothetical protein